MWDMNTSYYFDWSIFVFLSTNTKNFTSFVIQFVYEEWLDIRKKWIYEWKNKCSPKLLALTFSFPQFNTYYSHLKSFFFILGKQIFSSSRHRGFMHRCLQLVMMCVFVCLSVLCVCDVNVFCLCVCVSVCVCVCVCVYKCVSLRLYQNKTLKDKS